MTYRREPERLFIEPPLGFRTGPDVVPYGLSETPKVAGADRDHIEESDARGLEGAEQPLVKVR